jgi:hypothetical protein
LLTRRWSDITAIHAETPITTQNQYVVQKYIAKPFLIDGFKNDLRLYVLVSSISPLRAHLFHDGLVRLCTSEYVPPRADDCDLENQCAHLTNYAINKNSENFEEPADEGGVGGDSGSKRSVVWLMKHISETYGEDAAKQLWRKMQRLIAKMLLAVAPTIEAECQAKLPKDLSGGAFFQDGRSRCFEILGVDVMLDMKLKPWLIEVNHLPSFRCDAGLDADIKGRVLSQALRYIGADVSGNDKKRYEAFVARYRDGVRGEALHTGLQAPPGYPEEVLAAEWDRVWPPSNPNAQYVAQYENILATMAQSYARCFAGAPLPRRNTVADEKGSGRDAPSKEPVGRQGLKEGPLRQTPRDLASRDAPPAQHAKRDAPPSRRRESKESDRSRPPRASTARQRTSKDSLPPIERCRWSAPARERPKEAARAVRHVPISTLSLGLEL